MNGERKGKKNHRPYGAERRYGGIRLERTKGRHGCHNGIERKGFLKEKKNPEKDRKR